MGTDSAYARLEKVKEGNEDLTGFDVERIRAAARSQGSALRFVPLPFHGLIPSSRPGSWTRRSAP